MPKKKEKGTEGTDVLDTMITSLAELLEEKGIITQAEVGIEDKEEPQE